MAYVAGAASAELIFSTLDPRCAYCPDVKMVAEYLDHALQFERLALAEQNPELKEQLTQQAVAYRKLAADRAKKLGLESPK